MEDACVNVKNHACLNQKLSLQEASWKFQFNTSEKTEIFGRQLILMSKHALNIKSLQCIRFDRSFKINIYRSKSTNFSKLKHLVDS